MNARRANSAALALVSALAILSAGCSGEAPAPIVWQPRDVAVVPGEGGRVVQALWIRNGISLMARYRTRQAVGPDDLLLDPARQLVWLREGRIVQALTLPELEPFARYELAPEQQHARLAMGEDGALLLGGRRYRADGNDRRPAVAHNGQQPRG